MTTTNHPQDLTAPEMERLQQRIAELEAQNAEYAQKLEFISTGAAGNVHEAQQSNDEMLLFKALADFAPVGVTYSDLQGSLIYANRAFKEMTGHGERVLTMTIFDLYTQDAAYLGAAAQQVIDQGFWQGILTYHHADGHTFPGDVSVFLLRDAQNQPFGFGAFARDISQQQAQTERMRSFEALAEYAPDGVSISDLNGTFFYANPAFQQMTGFGSEVIGRTIFDIYVETPEQLGAAAQQVVQTGFWKGQLTYRRPDGSTFPGAVSVFLMRNQSGEPTGFGAVARDITVELRAESERIALQTQVIEAQQAALRELSTPLIPLADGVVAMPLIGSIDSSRAQLVIETLLQGVAEQKAHTTIIDITGVPVVDTQVASALLRAAQAVKLLGAKVVLTGIRPEVAQTLVGLGLDLSGITTRGTLQSGVAEALKR